MDILKFIAEKQRDDKDIDPIRTFKPLLARELDELYLYFRKHAFFGDLWDYTNQQVDRGRICRATTFEMEKVKILVCLFCGCCN